MLLGWTWVRQQGEVGRALTLNPPSHVIWVVGNSRPYFSEPALTRTKTRTREASVNNEVGVLHHPVEPTFSEAKVRELVSPELSAVSNTHPRWGSHFAFQI